MSSTTNFKGVNIPILQSDSNFPAWQRSFEGAARQNGLWEFFTGDEAVLIKPTKPVKPTTSTREVQPDPDVWRTMLDDYKLDIDEYRYQQDKIGEALGLLTQSVSSSYHSEIFANDMKDAYDFIKDQFKQSDWQRLTSSWDRFFRVSLKDSKTISRFVDDLKQTQSDIKEAKGTCPDSTLVVRIGNGLPREYDEWVLKNIKLSKDEPKVSDITSSLIAVESLIKTRRFSRNISDIGRFQTDTQQNRDDPRPKCTKCKKLGHNIDNCFDLHPHLKTEFEAKRKAVAADKKEFTTVKVKEKDDKNTIKIVRTLGALAYADPAYLERKRAEALVHNSTCTPTAPTTPVADRTSQTVASRRWQVVSYRRVSRNRVSDRPTPNHWRQGSSGSARSKNDVIFHNYFASLPEEVASALDTEPAEGTDAYYSPQLQDRTDTTLSSSTTVETDRPTTPVVSLFAAVDNDVFRDAWLFDSGANAHIVNNLNYVVDFKKLELDVGTADGNGSMQVLGEITIELPLLSKDGTIQTNYTIYECLYVPSSRCNLISVSRLTQAKARLHGIWNNGSITINHQDDEISIAEDHDGLYHIKLADVTENALPHTDKLAMIVDFKDKVWQWHFRLGHPSWEYMVWMVDRSEGMNITAKQIKGKYGAVCPVCATTKATLKIPREPARRRASRLGERLHIDIWGRYPVTGVNNSQYMLIITDDFSRYAWGEATPNRIDMAQRTINMINKIHKVHSVQTAGIRLD